jgi:hypothetical protein
VIEDSAQVCLCSPSLTSLLLLLSLLLKIIIKYVS